MRQLRHLGLELATTLAALAAFAAPALAQQQPQTLTVHQLKGDVYYAEGAGGNSGIIIGSNGVVHAEVLRALSTK